LFYEAHPAAAALISIRHTVSPARTSSIDGNLFDTWIDDTESRQVFYSAADEESVLLFIDFSYRLFADFYYSHRNKTIILFPKCVASSAPDSHHVTACVNKMLN
jgi:hypothetical protein